ncbi:MAG: glycoside hydrolase family 57 protein, partial [Planctomycetota bacterium]
MAAAVCFYFQVHQPLRLRRYSVFDASADYFDHAANTQILRKVANKCYLPATRLLLELIQRHRSEFRISFSLTGTVLRQFQQHTPEVLDHFKALADTGCVELLAETDHHALACLYSHDEFTAQVDFHDALIEETFGQRPAVFRNTELIYANPIAKSIAGLNRYSGILAEGVDTLLDGRSPNAVYTPPNLPQLPLLLKNYQLSDDLAFRFSDQNWSGYPLTPESYTQSILNTPAHSPRGDAASAASDPLVNLFMDFETFGEHQWEDTGIFTFLENFPQTFLDAGGRFLTPSEALDEFEPVGTYDAPHMTSWADSERDLSAWLGNAMQSSALQELYTLEPKVKQIKALPKSADPNLLRDWRQLTTSDHFYYMATKYAGDAQVHDYFSPYASPYDAYINFMNVMDHLRTRLQNLTPRGAPPPPPPPHPPPPPKQGAPPPPPPPPPPKKKTTTQA